MPQPVLPAPRTWASLDQVNAPRLRADASDAIALLAGRPLFIGQDTLGTALSSGPDNTIPMNAELADTWNGHNQAGAGAVPSQYFAQLAGWYLCESMIPYSYASTTQVPFAAGFIAKTGGVTGGVIRGPVTLNGSNHFPVPQSVDLILQTVTGPTGGGGDYIQPTGLQISGGNLNLISGGNQLPTVTVRWVAAPSGTVSLPLPPLAVCPSPVTHAWLNANVRDTVAFLVYPPICKAYYTPGSVTMPAQAFPSGTVINLNTVAVDNYGGYTTGASGGYTAPVAGNYLVAGQVNFAAYGTTAAVGYSCGLSVNGGTTAWGSSVFENTLNTSGAGAAVMRRIRLAAGDTVQLVGQQSTSGALAYNATAANQTRFIAVWEGS
jgi:hypothetical protein